MAMLSTQITIFLHFTIVWNECRDEKRERKSEHASRQHHTVYNNINVRFSSVSLMKSDDFSIFSVNKYSAIYSLCIAKFPTLLFNRKYSLSGNLIKTIANISWMQVELITKHSTRETKKEHINWIRYSLDTKFNTKRRVHWEIHCLT